MIEDYSEKTIILDVPKDEEDWNTWQLYTEKFNNFYIALHNLMRSNEFNKANIKWYWPYPITSFYELQKIIELKPSYLMIGPPLSFDLCKVSLITKDIPIRMSVNVAQPAYLPYNIDINGICGQWVRPEDVPAYEHYISCFEFEECESLVEEANYLQIYSKKQQWLGNLNFLVKKLNYNIDNRLFPEDFGFIRTTCGQKCFSNGHCSYCKRVFMFMENIKKEYSNLKQQGEIDKN